MNKHTRLDTVFNVPVFSVQPLACAGSTYYMYLYIYLCSYVAVNTIYRTIFSFVLLLAADVLRSPNNKYEEQNQKKNINYNFIDCCVRYGIWQDQFRMKFKRSCNQQEDERHSDQDTQIHRDTACRRTTFTEWSDWFVRIINRSIHKNSDVSVINEWQWHTHTHTHTLT